MPADGLTKSLGPQRHDKFCSMIGLVDEMERLNRELRLEELREVIHASRRQGESEQELLLSSRGSNTRILKEFESLRGCVAWK
jgi:hypothetical protein